MLMEHKQRSKKKIFLMIGIFLLILAVFRTGWWMHYQPSDQPVAEDGVIDLSDWNFTNNETVALDGEWKFIPNEFIDAETFKQQDIDGTTKQINVPENWNDSNPPFGYGTYYLDVLLPTDTDAVLGIKTLDISTAANLYINDQLIIEHGTISTNVEEIKGAFGPRSNLFSPNSNELSIIVHVANYEMPLSGGIIDSIKLGNDVALSKEAHLSIVLQSIIAIVFFLHAIYAFSIYFMGNRKFGKEILFFGIMFLLHGLTILIDDDVVLKLSLSFITYQKVLFLLFIATLLALVLFIKHLFNVQTPFYKWLVRLFIITMIFVLFATVHTYFIIATVVIILYIVALSFLFYYGVKSTHAGIQDALLILLFIASYTSNVLWGAFINLDLVNMPFYPFDFLITIIVVALLLFRKHIHLSKLNDQQKVELQELDKARDEFLAHTSHELRNPLHGMINIAESVLENDDEQLSIDSKENLQLLSNIGKRMGHTLNDLNTITQLRENRIKLSPTSIDLHVMTTFIIDMLEFLKGGKNIELTSQISADFPNIWADENRLIQILFNLVHNAIKYTENGSILIRAEAKEKQAFIYVQDTGIGIDPRKMENIFEPYAQVDPNPSIEAGIGIGLAISKKLVELHGGEITVRSNERGTTFLFSVPLSTDEQILELNTNSQKVITTQGNELTHSDVHYPSSNETILIVDDDPINVKIIAQLLNSEYNVITCTDPRKALEKIPLQNLDLIISDVMMPNMSGYEFTEKIREKYTISELPIVLITARNAPEDIRVSFKSGANDYLVKPVNALELKMRVRALTNLKHYIKESLKFEAAWLQAQIQPHFLFNTLNSIASLAEVDMDQMVDLLHAFGEYLQRSFALINLEPTAPIYHAIELTNTYLVIEKTRFRDRLTIETDIDEGIEHLMIPPLSIQPLIENAINHGILQKVEGGTVKWSIKKHPTYTEVTITDDGVGMNEEKVIEVLNVDASIDDGVGVKNTNRRLIHLYNEGLKIDSEVGKGTTISFRIPNET